MAYDAHKNFAISSVAVAPSPPLTGANLTVMSGEGDVFHAVPFNATVCPAGVLPTNVNAEIVRVWARAGDVLSLTRIQESTNARAIAVGDLVIASITAKALQEIETGTARTDTQNVWIAAQIYQASGYTRLGFVETSQPVDQRTYELVNTSQ